MSQLFSAGCAASSRCCTACGLQLYYSLLASLFLISLCYSAPSASVCFISLPTDCCNRCNSTHMALQQCWLSSPGPEASICTTWKSASYKITRYDCKWRISTESHFVQVDGFTRVLPKIGYPHLSANPETFGVTCFCLQHGCESGVCYSGCFQPTESRRDHLLQVF